MSKKLKTHAKNKLNKKMSINNTQEGELLLKEKYGSTNKEIYYVRPSEQTNVVIVVNSKIDFMSWFAKIFLPYGYPHSVSKDYLAYQIWDTAQAFCSTITGILATQEVFRGVGVGDAHSTPLAATITWVMKDGCGHLGKIFFAYTHGTYLDAYSKKWRLYADVLNDAAMSMEIALPLFKNYTTFVLCVSTVMKAIVGVAGGATRAALTQHHALTGNMADVAAKDAAQETFVNLIASLTALFILTYIGNSLIIFSFLMVLHVMFNYLAVRAVCLRTLNKPRFLHVIDTYLRKERIATPCEVNQGEPIMLYELGHNILELKLSGFHIKLGSSLKNVIEENRAASYLKSIKNVYAQRNYILFPRIADRTMYVLLKNGATTDDILCAYFHSILTSIVICAINNANLSTYGNAEKPKPFGKLCQILQNSDWGRIKNTDKCVFNEFKYNPSIELLTSLDEIFCKEWLRIKVRLQQTGWDLSKHLLMVDEWRLCNYNIEEKHISENIVSSEHIKTIDNFFIENIFDEFNSIHDLKNNTFTIEPEVPVSVPLSEKDENIYSSRAN